MSVEQSAAGRLLPGAAAAMLDLEEEKRAAQLSLLSSGFQDKHLKSGFEVLRGDPPG